jgi:hypothetical protein
MTNNCVYPCCLRGVSMILWGRGVFLDVLPGRCGIKSA